MKVLIFGIGVAGRAIYRNLIKNSSYEIVGFLENNENIVGDKFENTAIFSAKKVLDLDFDNVMVGGVWSDEMKAQLLQIGVNEYKITIVQEKDISFSTPSREIATDLCMKRLDEFLTSLNIPYFVSGSSLLCMLRKRPLSDVSDVDIMLTKYEYLEILAKKLPDFFNDLSIKIVYYERDDLVQKAGDIFKIIVSNYENEKLCLDISLYSPYKNYVTLSYNDKYFYVPKSYVSDVIKYPYKDFYLSIPKEFDKYLTLYYGKNYIEIPKHFCATDYGNLVNKSELDEICIRQ